jgi:hypothetical protein
MNREAGYENRDKELVISGSVKRNDISMALS